jgi:leucyl-tRNA synthetase
LKKIKSTKQEDMNLFDKEGVFTGSYAINPMNGEKVPVWAGNFVLADYGSGMVMAVPAHDQRDFEFAKKYKIPIKQVINGSSIKERAFVEAGVLVNSAAFNGLASSEAKEHITEYLFEKKLGKKTVNFRLKDWLISRQRFWGTPIPIVYCDKCGTVPVSDKDLPVLLPENIKFSDVKNPLTEDKKFLETKCPKCGGKARRETDTMDTFVNSSWYQLRYTDPKNSKEIFDKKKAKYWTPVDMYIGGKEHACLHLIYIRFYTKFLRDLGLIDYDEPAVNLFNQGMLLGEDGNKMSKSLGNVVLPESVSEKYGIDTARLFLVSVASSDKDVAWSKTGVEGSLRFIIKVFDYMERVKLGKSSEKLESKLNKTINEITTDIGQFRYNLAVIKLKELFDTIEKEQEINKKDLESFVKLLSPFCPHIAEELWSKLKNKTFVAQAEWPIADEKKINPKFEQIEKNVERTVSDVLNILKIIKEKQNKEAENIYLYAIPNELEFFNTEEISRRVGKPVKIFAVNDKHKYDPKSIAGKAKLGRPAIFVE